ncbi:MAG: type II toxin-antitoxin system Phd/YefM family antitoxin [Nitrospira sp.]|nr:type II toxin-antitoxin system Phd/YefM family antitoxin [Nitrospira sp.]MBP0122331.1 type II toxin-antitoxin system Phd/YefM family antitoxin [Nitrospira sp.]MBP0127777.1 type II toxin-antitoxin system Phd/YefM family antitoxin [Nitrospira sp.]MBP0130544.1 type II toxin-antitoxin system Phd/YefM family antitoxin [Nitrospira sp.]
MSTLTVSEARKVFAETVNLVAYTKERVMVERHGKAVVAMVPVEDVELLRDLEDRMDLSDVRAAIAEAKKKGTKPWSVLKKQLGL